MAEAQSRTKETGQPKLHCMLNLHKRLCGRRFARRDSRRSTRLLLQDLLHAIAVALLRDDAGWKLLAFENKLQLVGVKHFALQQGQSYADHGITVFQNDALGLFIAGVDQAAYFRINLARRLFTEVTML